MFSSLISSQVRRIVVVFGAALLVLAAAPPAHTGAADAQLDAIVRSALSQAPANFAAWRTGVMTTEPDGVSFKPNASMKQICSFCGVYDEYAGAEVDERYAIQFYWNVPKSWSRAQTLAYIQLHVGELVPSFKLAQGTDNDGESWFDWKKGTPTKFVYVETFSGKTQNGFEVRVGHYLPKNVHYLPYARLSAAQRADLANEVRNFVQLGVQNGSDNFTSLRGKATDKDNNYFDSNVSFGGIMKGCDVDGIFANESASGGTSKWFFECETPSLGGSKSDIEAIIRSAVVEALPDGFAATTDPKYLGTYDYRWDRSADSIAVEISSDDNDDGTIDYRVEIVHFTS